MLTVTNSVVPKEIKKTYDTISGTADIDCKKMMMTCVELDMEAATTLTVANLPTAGFILITATNNSGGALNLTLPDAAVVAVANGATETVEAVITGGVAVYTHTSTP